MEEQREADQTDYWLVQYQRLMDMKPQTLIDKVISAFYPFSILPFYLLTHFSCHLRLLAVNWSCELVRVEDFLAISHYWCVEAGITTNNSSLWRSKVFGKVLFSSAFSSFCRAVHFSVHFHIVCHWLSIEAEVSTVMYIPCCCLIHSILLFLAFFFVCLESFLEVIHSDFLRKCMHEKGNVLWIMTIWQWDLGYVAA